LFSLRHVRFVIVNNTDDDDDDDDGGGGVNVFVVHEWV